MPGSRGPARSLAASIRSHERVLRSDPGIRAVFASNGGFLAEGAGLRQPALAETLRSIAAEGPGALYGGDVGRGYAAGLRRAGSPMTDDDLAAHRAEIVPPLIGRYRDLDVRVVPPNSQGFVLLEVLAGVERMELDPDPLGPDAGLLALVFRAASADRDRHNADPHLERERRIGGVELVERLENRQPGPNGALGVVLVRNESAEDGHDRVPDELLDDAAIGLYPVAKKVVVGPQPGADVLGIRALRSRREPDEVAEEHGDDLALLACMSRA